MDVADERSRLTMNVLECLSTMQDVAFQKKQKEEEAAKKAAIAKMGGGKKK